MIDFISTQFHTNQFLTGAFFTSILLFLWQYLKSLPVTLWRYFSATVTASISVDDEDSLFQYAQQWLASTNATKWRRTFRITGNTVSEYDLGGLSTDVSQSGCVPDSGNYMFWHKGALTFANVEVKQLDNGTRGSKTYRKITITRVGLRKNVINTLLQEMYELEKEDRRRTVKVYQADSSYDGFSPLMPLPRRSIDGVVLNGNMMDDIIQDVSSFIESSSIYHKFGILHKRGYLLEGPPGTGKTSIIRSIASHFAINLFVFSNLSKFDDEKVVTILTDKRLTSPSILVFEDIDTVFNGRESLGKCTFGGFINAIDGIASREGVLTFFTTNRPEILDPALTRPGRIDRKWHVGNCTQSQAERLVAKFFGDRDHSAVASKWVGHSPAEMQGTLFTMRDDYDKFVAFNPPPMVQFSQTHQDNTNENN